MKIRNFFRENIENIYFRGENGINDMSLLHVTIVTSTITNDKMIMKVYLMRDDFFILLSGCLMMVGSSKL